MKKIIQISLICSNLLALEFGALGSISTSMGFAGVANKNNNFALYYNPALLSYSKSSFAFSTGINFSQKNLLELTSVDDKANERIENSLKSLTKAFEGSNYGNFSSVINDFSTRNANNKNTDIAKLAADVNSANLTTTIDNLNKKMQSDSNLSSNIRNEFLISIDNSSSNLIASGVNVNALKSIISSTDTGAILKLIDSSRQGQVSDIGSLADSLNSVNLSAILDNKSNDDINTVFDAIYDNEINASITTGIELNLASKDPEKLSALAFGVHNKIVANTYAGLNKQKSRLIIKLNDNSGDVYFEIKRIGNEIFANKVSKAEYDNHSAFSTGTKNDLVARTLIMTEVPVGYAKTLELPYGELSIGGALKYINAVGYYIDKGIEISFDGANSDDIKFSDDLKNPAKTNTVGLDAGLLYTYDSLSLGMVLKNINNPKIKFQHNHSIKLNPQVRVGAAYEYKKASFAIDLDLLPNKTLSYRKPKSQMIGGGAKYDFADWFNLRGGMAYDFKKDDGLILTTGFNLFNKFDFSFACSTKTSKYTSDGSEHSIPKYLDLKLGIMHEW